MKKLLTALIALFVISSTNVFAEWVTVKDTTFEKEYADVNYSKHGYYTYKEFEQEVEHEKKTGKLYSLIKQVMGDTEVTVAPLAIDSKVVENVGTTLKRDGYMAVVQLRLAVFVNYGRVGVVYNVNNKIMYTMYYDFLF